MDENFQSDSGYSAFGAGPAWLEALVLGRLGTAIAVLAVAGVGYVLLTGRLPIRDGMRVVLGCFILFGAPLIARGLIDLTRNDQEVVAPLAKSYVAPPVSNSTKAPDFDPYAGAAVPR